MTRWNNYEFYELSDCSQQKKINVCSLKVDAGEGSDSVVRFYFNAMKGRCKSFRFTGIGGNRNNYETLKECEEACKDTLIPGEPTIPSGFHR